MSNDPAPVAPPRRRTGDARRWDAARDEYLAGSPAEAVCRRHDLRLATFRRRAREKGWRRMDQPEADAPEPSSAPPAQDEPLVIPEAPPGAIGDAPLTAAQMVDRCWSRLQTAVAAGRVIEARGWMRLYKDLKPFARDEKIAAREARMDREAADRRAAETAEAAETAPAEQQSVALPLHCFSASESHAPPPADDAPITAAAPAEAAKPISTSDLARLAARLATVARQVEQAAHDEAVRLPLHCFSPPESHHGGADPLDQAMRELQTEILGLRGDGSRTPARPGAP